MRTRVAAVILFTFASAAPALSAPNHTKQIRAFEEFVESKMKSLGITGLSVGVVKDDFLWARGFGWADVENQVPAKAESSYRMGSVTKPMTAVAILRLVEEGKIDLDAEVQKYVPDFPRKQHRITVRQLLAHLGGISHYRDYEKEGRIRERKNTREALAIFQDFDLVAEPGTRYSYSSYGYNLLGAVIEGASGQTYGEFMREKVWGPLGMTETRMDDPREIIPNRVRGYERPEGRLRNSEYVDISSRFAAGGTRSTVLDMIKFVQGVGAGKVLKRETIDLMWTAMSTRDGAAIRYGLGWNVAPASGRFQVGHTGSQAETRTQLVYVPRQRFVIALASNYEDARLGVFANKVAELWLGDRWGVSMHADAPADQALASAVAAVFDLGLADYDRHGRARTVDPREVTAAFRYFNEAVDPRRLTALTAEDTMVRKGRDPSAGQPWVAVGSYMAHALVSGGRGDLDTYQREGPLRLFNDYVAFYRSGGGVLRHARFAPDTEKRLERWKADWARIRAMEAPLTIADVDDLARLEGSRARWRGASILPGYAGNLVDLAEQSAQRGEDALALRSARLAVDLYPTSEAANGILGVLTLLSGDVAAGEGLLRKAASIRRDGYARPENLTRIASFVARTGNRPGAIALLEVALRLDPASKEAEAALSALRSPSS